jgi:hypothetical protein
MTASSSAYFFATNENSLAEEQLMKDKLPAHLTSSPGHPMPKLFLKEPFDIFIIIAVR